MKKLLVAFCWTLAAGAADVRVECESFANLGGWEVETQSTRQMGSSYVMAHGYGVPVADATTTVTIPEAGRYAVWARTRNWNAVWTPGAAGRFVLRVNGTDLPTELGTGASEWHWAKAGEVQLAAGPAQLALHDLTGFNGRCDEIVLRTEEGQPSLRGVPVVKDCPKVYDLVVVGGGFAGSCTALAAARSGVKTLLLQDRDVLGGCNSSEVRVGLGGRIHAEPYKELGRVVEDIQPLFGYGRPLPAQFYEDARKETAFRLHHLYWGPGVAPDLRFRQYVYAVEMVSNRIAAVVARETHTGVCTRYRAKLFCDATGDAIISRLAGCEVMYGREARAQFNEISAPVKADRQVMGMSVQWLSEKKDEPAPFPDISAWALPIDEESGLYRTCGSWEQETGFLRDMADDAERIRDYSLLSIFSNWHWMKNKSARRADYTRHAFSWISPIGGKRESYRTVGAYVLTQNDIENQVKHPDGTAAITWDIDIHFPDPENVRSFKEPFRSAAYHRGFGPDYPVPYRCLYARDCANLFLSGRDISCSAVAFAAVRVQRTLGMLGEVVGLAASVCTVHDALPGDVSTKYLDELKGKMKKGVPRLPTFHGYQNGMGEKYDFNHRGWFPVYPPKKEAWMNAGDPKSAVEKSKMDDIRALGFVHRNEHPAFQDHRRRLILADESRGRLHYYDSADPSACFSVPVKKPVWDLKPLGNDCYRTVCHGGFQVVDMKARKVVDEFKCPFFRPNMATACCDLPGGGFLMSVSPSSGPDQGKAIHICEFGPDRKMRRVHRYHGLLNPLTMRWFGEGRLLLSHERGFAIVELAGPDEKGKIVKNFAIPEGRNLFDMVPDRAGTGYWAGTGYGAELVHYGLEGQVLSAWKAAQGGKQNYFYAQVEERPDGHVYVANWTGHGAGDSYRGWQVIEFDAQGQVVWRLDSPERFGSISGVVVLDESGR